MSFSLSLLVDFFKPAKKSFSPQEIETLFPPDKFIGLEKIIGTSIEKKNIYIEALIHRSFLEENDEFALSNERLEFLGDSVLNLAIGEYLFNKFPKEEEGFLTKVRAKMVNRNALSSVAECLGLGEYILLGSNLPKSITHNSKSLLSDALEALIGAIYLDKGFDTCKKFIQSKIIEPVLKDGDHLIDENYKSQLLEYTQANKFTMPVYKIISEEGPHHNKTFTAEVVIDDKILGEGKGKSKKEAEQNAASVALKKISKSHINS